MIHNTVADWMIADPLTVAPTDTLLHAYQLMVQNRFRHLPVVAADGKLVGMVTKQRVRWIELMDALVYKDSLLRNIVAQSRVVGEQALEPVVTIVAATPIMEAIHLFRRHRITALIVINEAGGLSGILTESDLYRFLRPNIEALYA